MKDNPNIVEFYHEDSRRPMESIRSSAIPREGEYISIKKKEWKVKYVTWAIDTSGNPQGELRACVVLAEREGTSHDA